MNRTRRTTAVAVATGALALGVGIGAATIASADPTPTPSASPSVTPGQPQGGPGHRGGRGLMQEDNAKALADQLGVSEAKVTDALKAFREANRPAKPKQDRTNPANRPDPAVRDAAMAKSLASTLGVSEAKVKAAIEEVRSAARAERATALKTKLDAAVKAGTLTQAEADAVTKAVDQGVIRVGPR